MLPPGNGTILTIFGPILMERWIHDIREEGWTKGVNEVGGGGVCVLGVGRSGLLLRRICLWYGTFI